MKGHGGSVTGFSSPCSCNPLDIPDKGIVVELAHCEDHLPHIALFWPTRPGDLVPGDFDDPKTISP